MVGETLNEIRRQDSEILAAVIDVMETEKLLASGATVFVLPEGASVLLQLGQEASGVDPPQVPRQTRDWQPNP